MRNSRRKSIQQQFFRVLLVSAILQIVIISFIYGISRKIHSNNLLIELNRTLLLQDDVASEMAKFKYLGNDFALHVQLYAYQNTNKLDKVEFFDRVPNNLKDICLVSHLNEHICNIYDIYYGVTPILFDNKVLGYVITSKHYKNQVLDEPYTFFYIIFAVISGILLINFFLISWSVKKYIKVNLSNLLSFIHGKPGYEQFTTLEHFMIASALALEKENNKKLQEKIMHQEVEQLMKDIVRQVTHNIRSPLTTLQILYKNNQDKLSPQEHLQFRAAINDIFELVNNLTFKIKNTNNSDEMSDVPRYLNLYWIISTAIANKVTELRDSSCNIQIITDNFDINRVWVHVSSLKFNSIVSNLLNNAYEAESELEEKNIKIELSVKKDHFVEITIIDDGMGIPQDKIRAVMSGLSLKKDGHGIGLSSSIKYIEAIGGEVNINSTINKGTTITISIPMKYPTFVVSNLNLDITKTIIVVDDDTSIHQFWRKRAKELRMRSMHFVSPQDFLSWYSENSDFSGYYFIDYYYSNSNLSGIDILEKANLSNKFLVTNDYDSVLVQEYVRKYAISLIPKFMLQKIPVTLTKEGVVENN